MASRAQRIVDDIVGSDRYAQIFSDRVFTDEPILRAGARDLTPPKRPEPVEPEPPTAPAQHAAGQRRGVVAGASAAVGSTASQAPVGPAGTSAPTQMPATDVLLVGGSGGGASTWHLDATPQETELPETLVELRHLAPGSAWSRSWGGGGTKVFFEQARFAEDYTDDFEGTGAEMNISSAYLTYELLTDYQLRMYFAWRTRWRAGIQTDCPAGFLYLNTYELLSGIGVEAGEQGLAALVRLRDAYQDRTSFAVQLTRWIHDYVIYYDLDAALLPSTSATSAAFPTWAVSVLRQAEDALIAAGTPAWPKGAQARAMGLPEEERLLDALCHLSRYRAERSRYVKDHRNDVATVAARVFARMVAHCHKRRKTDYVDGLFGTPTRVSYTMFPQALIQLSTRHPDAVFEASHSESFTCERGFWWRHLPCRKCETSRELGNLMHAIDCRMRVASQDPHPLKAKPLPKYQGTFVDAEIEALVAERAAEEAARIHIDHRNLQAIRSAAARTREALLTDDDLDDVAPRDEGVDVFVSVAPAPQVEPQAPGAPAAPSQTLPQEGAASDALGLTAEQLALVRRLLAGEAIAETGGQAFLSLAVDAINEAFLDLVGDAVVEETEAGYALVEDYEEDVAEALEG